MKHLILLLTILSFQVRAQNLDYPTLDSKRDYNWIFGQPDTTIDGQPRGSQIDFGGNGGLFEVTNPYISIEFSRTNTSISDSNGEFLFAFNGQKIMDNDYEIAINGADLNIHGQGEWWYWEYGYAVPQGGLILPDFNDSTLYHLFHMQLAYDSTIPSSENQFYCNALLHTIISKPSLESPAIVLEKNIPILENTRLQLGKLVANRHANGRDWWIPVFNFNDNQYRQFLFTPEGLVEHGIHQVDLPILQNLGQGQFSNDGSIYLQHNGYKPNDSVMVDIFEFDRCTGILSNQNQHIYQSPGNSAYGAAISSNNTKAYLIQSEYIVQINLEIENPFTSWDTVAVYDGFMSPFWTNFYTAQITPNNKIFIVPPNGTDRLHIIQNPNQNGIGCNFEQHVFELPSVNNFSIPYFPNFRLGRLEGSPCDTLFTSTNIEPEKTFYLNIYPNPSKDNLSISFGNNFIGTLGIYDLNGKNLKNWNIKHTSTSNINISSLSSGVYILKFKSDKGFSTARKIIISN